MSSQEIFSTQQSKDLAMFVGYLYVVGSKATDIHNLRKIGLTTDPIHRMQQYMTGDPPDIGYEKEYQGLWETTASNTAELRMIEKFIHSCLSHHRKVRKDGQSTEWFEVSLEKIQTLISTTRFIRRCLTIEEVTAIQRESKTKVTDTELASIHSFLTPYELFRAIFIPGGVPRRIQQELWDIFASMCDQSSLSYRGIIQWPTGVGKTIATLITIVLYAKRCKERGEIYRGLFITPKNDILDTISKPFQKLKEFGILYLDGSHGELNKMTIPSDVPILMTACQKILTDEDTFKYLPTVNHIHYDEVHRITGNEFFQLLNKYVSLWKTDVLIGTSATPQTSSPQQQKKLEELFGNPLQILHRCDVDEAVQQKWIAPPRFIIGLIPKDQYKVQSFIDTSIDFIKRKGKIGKHIFYIESSVEDATFAEQYIKHKYPEIDSYSAIDGFRTDKVFVASKIEDRQQVLVACQRYREGSDVAGLEVVSKLVGDSFSAHTLLQICGRSMRLDYPEKEGWCVLVKACDREVKHEDVLDSILFEIADFMGKTNSCFSKKDVKKFVETFIGNVSVYGHRFTLAETIERIQAAFLRREYVKRTAKEKYWLVKQYNRELGLSKRDEYMALKATHPMFVEDPKTYFKEDWVSWYDFLGVDTSNFPQTKAQWICVCKEKGFEGKAWSHYQLHRGATLPEIPGHMYEDYTNWDAEIGVEDELVW